MVVLDVVVAEDSHGVNHGVGALRLLDSVLERVPARARFSFPRGRS
jgi:hypothetical protein